MDKYKSSFLNNCYEWLFSQEERAPVGFIPMLCMMIVVSTVVGIFLMPIVSKLMQ